VLKGIPGIIRADLLHILASMGHGDELAIVDRNYPAASSERPVVYLEGVDVCQAGEAILRLLPIDEVVSDPVIRMEVIADAGDVPAVQKEFVAMVSETVGRPVGVGQLPRQEFYDRVRRCFAVVATGEPRPYGCFILTAGVLPESGA
jgi:L-fucose mutarotase